MTGVQTCALPIYPAKAAPGTVRALYGENVQRNAVHGSDAPATAAQELAFFFPRCDLP